AQPRCREAHRPLDDPPAAHRAHRLLRPELRLDGAPHREPGRVPRIRARAAGHGRGAPHRLPASAATPLVLSVVPLTGLPEVRPGDDLAALLGDAAERAGGLEEGDVLVVAQKAVSKAEGRVEQTEDVVAAILREARAVRRRRGDLVIAETEHGFVCASAGVDRSNAPGEGWI